MKRLLTKLNFMQKEVEQKQIGLQIMPEFTQYLIGILGEMPAKISCDALVILKNPQTYPQFLKPIYENENELINKNDERGKDIK